ncbi:TraB/GumN family protein [Paenibacillus sp. Z3-2]
MKNWKHMLLSLTISVGLLASAAPALAAPQEETSIKVNDQAVEYTAGAPINNKGTTLVPLRSTLDAMDVKLKTATDDTITAVVDGKTITLKNKLTRINGVTYAPIRIVGDAIGYEVNWDAKTRTVLLVSKGTETAEKTGSRGFMWEVESNGNTVYLVGSMHLADDSFYPLHEEFEEAFAEADYLGVELDVSKGTDEAQQQLILDLGSYQDGTTLKDHVSSETYAKLGDILKKNGLEPDVLDEFKPWVVENTLASLKTTPAGYEGSAGVDLYFVQKAIERKLPIIELESYEFQLNMFNNFSKELQEENLNTTLDNFDVLDDDMNQLAEMWKTGNDEQLLEFTNTYSDNEEYNKAMLIDRNIGMANKIDGYLKSDKKEEYFIVIGAAHYLGEHGIVKLLEDKGYSVERK